ncbi:hypothetical protein C943_01282 [Mariniradius saccharolyticus AK6]|uniref:Uncharacterized protein n=1 Tax=Mariniradius saccharolyticus AK6 TaxID=1239962 RepID=M7X523_9BACT|nr:hypothetical protein C943_01282 [Mariniradius saccharolyticus AK6]
MILAYNIQVAFWLADKEIMILAAIAATSRRRCVNPLFSFPFDIDEN